MSSFVCTTVDSRQGGHLTASDITSKQLQDDLCCQNNTGLQSVAGSSSPDLCDTEETVEVQPSTSSTAEPCTAAESSRQQLKLPLVKPRGRPKNKPVQRKKSRKKQSKKASVPFAELGIKNQHKILMTGIVGEDTCCKALNDGYIIEEADVETRPELLPSALLDHRVRLRQLRPHFSNDAWEMLTCAVTIKRKNKCSYLVPAEKKTTEQSKWLLVTTAWNGFTGRVQQ